MNIPLPVNPLLVSSSLLSSELSRSDMTTDSSWPYRLICVLRLGSDITNSSSSFFSVVSISAFFAHFFQKSGSSIFISDLLDEHAKLAFENVDPFSASIVIIYTIEFL